MAKTVIAPLALVCALGLLGPLHAYAASPALSAPAAAPTEGSVSDEVLRDGWAGDRALAAQRAEQGGARSRAGAHEDAARRFSEAAALDPWHAEYAVQLAREALQTGQPRAALAAWHKAATAALSYPARAGTLSATLAATLLAWGAALTLGAVVLTSRLAKCFGHGLVHRLGRTPSPEPTGPMRFAPAILATLGLVLAASLLGPLGAAVLALLALSPCASRPERQALAPLVAASALLIALMPAVLDGLRQGGSSGEVRFWATQDKSAAWARSELMGRAAPERRKSAPRDVWALGLLALRERAPREADTLLSSALTNFPNEPALYCAAAEAAYGRGDLERAAQLLGQAKTLTPRWALIHFNLSQVLLAQAKPTEAQQARQEAFARGGSQLLRDVTALERRGGLLLPTPWASALLVEDLHPRLDRLEVVANEAVDALWQPLGARLPRSLLGALCAAGALLLLVFARPLPRRGPIRPPRWPRLCGRCGAIACPSCHSRAAAAGHCAACFAIDTGTEVDLSARMAQQRRTRAARARQQWRVRAGSWLWPGLGLLAAGAMRPGVLFAAVASLLVELCVAEALPAGFAPYAWLLPHVSHAATLLALLGGYVVLLWLARRQAQAQLG